jgi:acyl-CoA synthetase (NDP forming)
MTASSFADHQIYAREHALDSLLKPASIALVGASERDGSPGRILAELIIDSSFEGRVYPVNPGYQTILDTPCYADLVSLPETVDHVVLAVSNQRIEDALASAINHGAKAATIYSSCILEHDTDPPLKTRLENMANKAGIAICGGNCMGFYSIQHGLYAGMYPIPGEMQPGSISFIAQSGSAFTALAHNGLRLKFNLCVSSGNELSTTIDQYMDWSLHQPETRVIGLFLETVRNPRGFIATLKQAREKNIPVVILKVGKSPLGAAMATTHTGAIAGDHVAYEAVFKKYGVIEVSGFDEMAAVLMMFQSPRRPGPGKLASIQESGGFMEMITDICHRLKIDFAEISDQTKDEISQHLDPGLKADNPLDAWGSNDDFENRFYYCMSALMKDRSVAVGAFFTNFRDGYYMSEAFVRMMEKISHETDKPIAMGNCYSDISHNNLSQKTAQAGIPFIDGAEEALIAIKHLFNYRDKKNSEEILRDGSGEHEPDPVVIDRWKSRLESLRGQTLSERDSLQLLEDFSLPVPGNSIATSVKQAIEIAQNIGFPVVIKTAEAGISHKSDQHGVVVNITNETELTHHYQDLEQRLGPKVLISKMISAGTEVGLGMVNDPQFGPLVMVSAGGVFIELLSDRSVTMAPVSTSEADRMLNELKINNLIQGLRGTEAGDRQALIDFIVHFSHLAYALREHIKAVDINPVIVNATGAIAVDALVVSL